MRWRRPGLSRRASNAIRLRSYAPCIADRTGFVDARSYSTSGARSAPLGRGDGSDMGASGTNTLVPGSAGWGRPIFGTSMARERHLWDIDGPAKGGMIWCRCPARPGIPRCSGRSWTESPIASSTQERAPMASLRTCAGSTSTLPPSAIVWSHDHFDHSNWLEYWSHTGPGQPARAHPPGLLAPPPDHRPRPRAPGDPNHQPSGPGWGRLRDSRGSQPSFLLDGSVLIIGGVPRLTGYEPGFRPQQAWRGGQRAADPLVSDDQAQSQPTAQAGAATPSEPVSHALTPQHRRHRFTI